MPKHTRRGQETQEDDQVLGKLPGNLGERLGRWDSSLNTGCNPRTRGRWNPSEVRGNQDTRPSVIKLSQLKSLVTTVSLNLNNLVILVTEVVVITDMYSLSVISTLCV